MNWVFFGREVREEGAEEKIALFKKILRLSSGLGNVLNDNKIF